MLIAIELPGVVGQRPYEVRFKPSIVRDGHAAVYRALALRRREQRANGVN